MVRAASAENVLELIDTAAEVLVFEVDVVRPVTYRLGVHVAAAREQRVRQLEQQFDLIAYVLCGERRFKNDTLHKRLFFSTRTLASSLNFLLSSSHSRATSLLSVLMSRTGCWLRWLSPEVTSQSST